MPRMKTLLLVTLTLLLNVGQLSAATDYPPTIRVNPPREVVFEIANSIQLPCIAEGSPAPTYRWTFNDKDFDASGKDNRVVQLQGMGTLLFSNPLPEDQGYYKCYASNPRGTALADTTHFLNATLGVFPSSVNQPPSKLAGQPLRIICPKPVSFPEAEVLWQKLTVRGTVNIDYDDRITMDHDGGLNFAFLNATDNGDYRCVMYNKLLRKSENSLRFTVKVTGDAGKITNPPAINWVTPTTESFLRGRQAAIKCIFSGRPTPNVIWRRVDGKKLSVRTTVRSFGLELFFNPIDYDDGGVYECAGWNEAAPLPATSTVQVQVFSMPQWVYEPFPVTKGINETVTFICKGEGKPQVSPTRWFRNTVRIDGSSGNIVIGDDYGPGTTLTVMNLQQERDTMALQCNISNNLQDGWIHKSFYINVQSEKPTIILFDGDLHKWAARQSYNLSCTVFGAPTPIISWKKDGMSLTGGRFITHDDGTLEIQNVGITDAGNYSCQAINMLGSDMRWTTVVVRRQTKIQQAPEDLTVQAGVSAKFVCTAITDGDEAQFLTIQWKKDGNLIDYTSNTRMFLNAQDNSLQIAGPTALDTGTYTCQATNGIDVAEASASLRVQDRPDPPVSVIIDYCKTNSARIKWVAGVNNNTPLQNFIIQFQTAFDKSVWYTMTSSVSPKITQMDLDLKPSNEYTFRLLSQNKIGVSEPSTPTPSSCTTLPARPLVNPKGVRTIDEGNDRLVITWNAVSPVDFGGSNFQYTAKYRKKGESFCNNNRAQPYCTQTITSRADIIGRPGELNLIEYKITISEPNSYTAYEIAVISVNGEGESGDFTNYTIGYSGEGDPTQAVTGFTIKLGTNGAPLIYSDNATFEWNAVDETDEKTRGFFRGYRITYTKTVDGVDELFDTRSIFIILRDVKKEGQPYGQRRLLTNTYGAVESGGKVTVTLTHLPPNSNLQFKIAVINKRRLGTSSIPLDITTKEGVPGPVNQLEIDEHGPTHVRLSWEQPIEPNGVITGYMVGYKTIDGLQMGPLQFPEQRYIKFETALGNRTASKLTGLKPLQMYRFYIWAYTAAGQGAEYFIDDSTVEAGYPGAPTISVQRLDNSTLNVSWIPSAEGIPANVFYVQYKQESAVDQWQRSGWEINNNYIMVSNFVEGWRYELRVVASNGGIYETASESINVFPTDVSRASAEAKEVFSSAWFIGLIVCLILLIAVIVLVCYVRQNQGGIYTGQYTGDEAEPLRPAEDQSYDLGTRGPGSKGAYDLDTPVSEKFSERQSEKYSQPPPPDDEYMQDDPSRYTEEGSFIGQYGEKRELPDYRSAQQRPVNPYKPAGPTPYARQAPSEYRPAAEPRGYYSAGPQNEQGAVRIPPARQTRAAQNDYRPPLNPSQDYGTDTRYRPASSPDEQDADHSGTQTVV